MSNASGNAYALTTLCPITNGAILDDQGNETEADDKVVRTLLQDFPMNDGSFVGVVGNTYLGRLFILKDILLQQGN